jgi:DnaJ-domain-containing protein 1
MMPPGVEPGQNSSTFDSLCACGCGVSVKPGQRWHEPACKARAYRAQKRASYEAYGDEMEDESWQYHMQIHELSRKLEDLERAYSELWEQHQNCRRVSPVAAPERPWLGDAYAILGVRPDAEPEATEGAYKALVKKYHPDYHPGDPVIDARMKAITAAYAVVMRGRGDRQKRR